MLRRPPATVRAIGQIAATAAIAGAIGGAAIGSIDGLWSWDRLSQFTEGAGKIRSLLFVAVIYAFAAAIVTPLVAITAVGIARASRLGEAITSLRDLHSRLPAARVSLALVVVPCAAVALGVVFIALTPVLEPRKHFGLVIAMAMTGAVIGLAAGLVFALLVARILEWAIDKVSGPRLARALSTGDAALAGLAIGLAITLGLIVWRAWKTLSLLQLRPFLVVLLVVTAAAALRKPARRVAIRIAAKSRSAMVFAGGFGITALLVLILGAGDGARKAAVAHTGLSGPLATAFRSAFDLDRDGYSRVLGGGDCNDWDSAINPGAPEIPEDGVDNNCVGGDVVLERDVSEVGFSDVPAAVPKDFNVLLVTIDTIRADHLGAYGYKRETSPALDQLAAEGALFVNGWAHAPSTRYSIPAILTGRLPLNVEYFPLAGAWPGIATENDTIAEVLKSRGFTTGAILNYWYFEERRRMNQGFDHYDNKNRVLHKAVSGKGPAQTKGSSSKEQTDKAIEFLDARGGSRFFLWVHYYDPHYAYEKHPGTKDFGNSRIGLYDHEIRYTDDHIGRLIADLKRRGLYEKTVIVVTGDHGEGFGEHGIDLHGYHLYSAQTKVPLIIRVPGVAPRRVESPAAHVDILPTLANLAGAAATPEMDGRSLVGEITGASTDPDRIVFQQLSFENNNEMRAAVSAKCHVIFNVSPHRSWETYEIDEDPDEKRDRPGSAKCAPVRAALEAFYDRSEIPKDAMSALLEAKPPLEKELNVDFGGAKLLAIDVPKSLSRGQTVPITLTWQAKSGFSDPWKVFVHLEGPAKSFIQADHGPARPTHWWKDGQYIRYSRPLRIPATKPAGTYQIYVGLFRGKERHPVSVDGRPVNSKRARVGTATVSRSGQ